MNDAPQGGFFSRLWDSIMLWFHGDKKAAAEAPVKSTDAK
jgi:D-alanyl-D-alanine carboxypeptidase (penicillin-binding protein 5/6)